MKRLCVHENQRMLIQEDGEPFFWLADTAWEMFHRLNREEAEHYLATRSRQGFNVIQAVALAELDGLRTPNPYGDVPLIDLDPERPNEAYFRHVDFIVRLAAQYGLYIGLLPTWGDKVVDLWGDGPVVFNPANARTYGRYLGHRYREDSNVLWILGGDRPGDGLVELWSAMAQGIEEGLGRHPFITLHPAGGRGSSEWFHAMSWLEMNMWQSGHGVIDAPTWEMITRDYARIPRKPVLDGEPNYEDHPIDPWTRKWEPRMGRFTDHDVRKQTYRSVFAGACGVTYGHHAVWQCYRPPRDAVNFPAFTWEEAIFRPAAGQMVHLKNLMLSRPYESRIPDQGMIFSNPGEGGGHIRATRDVEGSYGMVYLPLGGQSLELDLSRFAGPVKAWWYDPRNGNAYETGHFANQGTQRFIAPLGGPDWVLVLDEAARRYAPPGR